MKFSPLPEVAYLRERLDYNPETGIFLWRSRPTDHFTDVPHRDTWNTRYAGKPAGTIAPNGYRKIALDDRQFMAHRIAWLMFYGTQVPHDLDHMDGDRANNRIANLRLATRAENLANSRRRNTNTGVKGVWFDAGRGKFQVHLTANHKQHNIGRFSTLEEAIDARRKAAERLHGKFARHE